MDFQTAVRTCFQKYADFDGRAGLPEYWWFMLFVIGAGAVLNMVSDTLGTLFSLAIAVPVWAAGARRLHDTDRSGWWQLLAITVIGLIPLIMWLAAVGNQGRNQYGERQAAAI